MTLQLTLLLRISKISLSEGGYYGIDVVLERILVVFRMIVIFFILLKM